MRLLSVEGRPRRPPERPRRDRAAAHPSLGRVQPGARARLRARARVHARRARPAQRRHGGRAARPARRGDRGAHRLRRPRFARPRSASRTSSSATRSTRGSAARRRVLLHRRVVAALEALHGDDLGPHLAELAHHAIAGRDDERAVRYAHARGRARPRVARRRGGRAAVRDRAGGAGRLATSALAAGCCSRSARRSRAPGTAPAARAALLAAARLARRLGLAPELARAAAEYGGRIVYARASADPQLLPLLEEGLDALGERRRRAAGAAARAPGRSAARRAVAERGATR